MWINKKGGLLVSTQTFYILTPYFRVLAQTPPVFRDRTSNFSDHSFSFFESVLRIFWGMGLVLLFLRVNPSLFWGQTFPFHLANFDLISLSSFYSLWVWLDLTWGVSRKFSLSKNWFRGNINKIFLCRVYQHWNFRIFKCVSWTINSSIYTRKKI